MPPLHLIAARARRQPGEHAYVAAELEVVHAPVAVSVSAPASAATIVQMDAEAVEPVGVETGGMAEDGGEGA